MADSISFGLIKADLMTAHDAIRHFLEKPRIKDFKNIAAYHIEQAVEKLIKIQIYQYSEKVDHRRLYTHNIGVLIAYADQISSQIIIPSYIRTHSEVISGWEAESRYDIHFSVKINQLEKALSVAEEWLAHLSKVPDVPAPDHDQ